VDGDNETMPAVAHDDGGARTDLWRRPGYLIRRLHQIHVAMFLEECAAFSLTPVQYAVMTVLLEQPERDQISIAAEAGIDRTNVADVLTRLEERGVVTRRVSDSDRRMKLTALTPAGERLARDMVAAMLRAQERFLSPLSSTQRDQLMALMTVLVDANNAYSRAPARNR
jgi:DNA-binding MarR family transcriptional regulator